MALMVVLRPTGVIFGALLRPVNRFALSLNRSLAFEICCFNTTRYDGPHYFSQKMSEPLKYQAMPFKVRLDILLALIHLLRSARHERVP